MLDLTERILRLRQIPPLRGLPVAEISQLAQSIVRRTFQRDDILLREDEAPRAFFLLVSGVVTMRRRGKRIGTVRGPGGVGYMSFLARDAGGTAAIAESVVECYEVPADAMEEIFEDHFAALLGSMRSIAERLVAENQKQTVAPPYTPSAQAVDHLLGDRELGIVERIYLLRRTRAFSRANVNSLATLARQLVESRPGPGETVWRPGERSDGSIFVVKGRLDLTWNDGKTVQEVGPGYVIGGAESIVGVDRWNTLVTRTPAVLLRGTREGLIDIFEDDTELALHFMSMLATVVMRIWDTKAEAGQTSVGSEPSAPAPPAAEPEQAVAQG